MNTEKLEKLRKSLNNNFIPENMKEKIKAEISRLEAEIKNDEITPKEVKEEVKDIEVKVEEALEVAEEKKEEAKEEAKEEKKPKSKRANTSKKGTESKKSKPTAMALAKEIRKEGESWKDAVARARKQMNGVKDEVKKETKSELSKLKELIKGRKDLKGVPHPNLMRDAHRRALPSGKRTSADGSVYYEYRRNRTDKSHSGSLYLAEGGGVWTKEQREAVAKLDSIFEIAVEDKGIKRNSKEASDFWRSGGFQQRMRKIFNKENDEKMYANGGDFMSGVYAEEGAEVDEEVTYFINKDGIKVRSVAKPEKELTKAEWMAKHNESPEAIAYSRGGDINVKQLDLGYAYNYMNDEDNLGSLSKEHGIYFVLGFENGKHFSESFEKFDDAKKFYLSKKNKFALGGGIFADTFTGTTGTHYTGLVGETNAMSSGEMFANGGVILDNVKIEVYKSFHGLKAENYFQNVNGFDWNVVTMKRHSGNLVSTAKGGKSNKSGDIEFFKFDYNSPNITLISSRPSRVTEKVIETQHRQALEIFKEKMDSNMFAYGGAMKYHEGGNLEQHGLEVGDEIIKTIGAFQKVKDKKGNIVYVDLKTGYRDTKEPLPFSTGGALQEKPKYKIGDSVYYLGKPSIIKGINQDMLGRISYKVAYKTEKGTTTVADYIKDFEIEKESKYNDGGAIANQQLIADAHLRPAEMFGAEGIPAYKRGGAIKESDIKVGDKFLLANNEVVDIKRLFIENTDEQWVEFTRTSTHQPHMETSLKELKLFLNRLDAKRIILAEKGKELIGNQSHIDMNHNGQIDSEDFKILRNSMNGAWRNEHKHINHNEPHEVRYARKHNSSRTGYKGKSHFDEGGKITFKRKAKAIADKFEGKAVAPKYQDEYGKTYDREEAQEVGNKIAGAMRAKGMDKKAFGGFFGKAKESMSKGHYPNLDNTEVRLKNGEYVQVLDQSGGKLYVMELSKLGTGAVPKYVDISQVEDSYFMGGGKVSKAKKSTAKKQSSNTKRGGAMQLAKQIRKEGEKWTDALKRANAQLRK